MNFNELTPILWDRIGQEDVLLEAKGDLWIDNKDPCSVFKVLKANGSYMVLEVEFNNQFAFTVGKERFYGLRVETFDNLDQSKADSLYKERVQALT